MGRDILKDIVEHTQARVARQKAIASAIRSPGPPEKMTPYRVFRQAIARPGGVRLIAEIKKASPSAGLICPRFDPAGLARIYTENGAAALSVLTEENFFQGRLEYMRTAGEVSGLPVLRKDFIIDEIQVDEAYRFGASAVLLIVAILEDRQLASFLKLAGLYDLDCLVEVHNEQELDRALQAGADMIGINNRDLRTFNVDLAVSERLIPRIPKDKVTVAESGIKTHADIERLAAAGANAVLIGESLLRADDVGKRVREILQGEKKI